MITYDSLSDMVQVYYKNRIKEPGSNYIPITKGVIGKVESGGDILTIIDRTRHGSEFSETSGKKGRKLISNIAKSIK